MSTQPIFFKLNTGARTATQIKAIIVQIDNIIESLFTTALVSVGNADIVAYEIETGQTKTKVEYSTPGQVTSAIENYEKIRQMYANKLAPRVITLMDSRNFRKG